MKKRLRWLLFSGLAGVGLLLVSVHAATLKVSLVTSNIVVSWPTQASSYWLESSSNLRSSNSWFVVTNTTTNAGGQFSVQLPIGSSNTFYRLQGVSSSPVVNGSTFTNSVYFGGGGSLNFDYTTPDADVAFLVVTVSNVLGTFTNLTPASLLNLGGISGHASIPLGDRSFALGDNRISIRLKDQRGALSAPTTFNVTLAAQNPTGSAPVLSAFAPDSSGWGLPLGPRDRFSPGFTTTFADADGDILRARLKIQRPDSTVLATELSAQALGITGNSGTVTLKPLKFRSTDPAGSYTLFLTLIDSAGHLSSTLSTSFNVFSSGAAAPHIYFFSPDAGSAGTNILIYGTGFDAASIDSNSVTIADVEAKVLTVDASSLTVILPEVKGSGRIMVRNRYGVAISDQLFVVPAQVTVSPVSPSVMVGEPLSFTAKVISAFSPAVTWTVNGINGGNAAVGTISGAGIYVAPADIPTNGVVTITATLVENPAVSNQTTIQIGPPPVTHGSAKVLASLGGTVRSLDGRAAVSFAAGTLASNLTASVIVLRGTNLPPPQSGRQVVSAVEFGPSGQTFSPSVSVTLPLVRAYPSGTLLPLKFYLTNGTYLDEGLFATVAANGNEATAQISHFSIAVIDDAAPANPPLSSPTITSLSPGNGLEGTRVPVLITGTLLTDDLTPEIRTTNGLPTADIVPDTLFVKSTNAGVLLHIQTLRDLGAGASRSYLLRLSRPNAALYAEFPFTVNGLAELHVTSTQVVQLSGSNLYSEVLIEGPTPAQPSVPLAIAQVPPTGTGLPVQILATGPIVINGRIDASGAAGGSAFGINPGIAPPGGMGGAGGRGRDDSGCSSFALVAAQFGAYECAPPGSYGSPGNVTGTNHFHDLIGYGGVPGVNVNIFEEIISAIINAISCIGSLGHNVLSCAQLVAGIIQIADDVNDLSSEGTTGRKGFAAASGAEHGGGGGGGGGNNIGFLAADLNGGGGGAGGDGGRSVTILTADTLSLSGPTAMITTAGGAGGSGSAVTPNGPVSLDSSNHVNVNSGFVGGGGGGGSAGRLEIGSAGSPDVLFQANNTHAAFFGGKGGLGGFTSTEVNGVSSHFTYRSAEGEDGPAGKFLAYGPVYDPGALKNMVTARNALRIQSTQPQPTGPLPVVNIQGAQPGDQRTAQTVRDVNGYLHATLVLFPGFNTVSSPGQNSLFEHRILVLTDTDTDGDGLSDADELDLGTNPNDVDSDADTLGDSQELLIGSNPNIPDTDGDGLTDAQEHTLGTSPNLVDTDGDNVMDGAEIFLGTDPLVPTSVPLQIPGGTLLANSGGPDGARLTLLDTGDGHFGLMGKPNGGLGFGLAFNERGGLFIAALTSLSKYDPLSGLSYSVGSFQLTNGTPVKLLEIAYNPANHVLYGVERGPSPDFAPTGQLLRIDPRSAIITRLGSPLASPIHSLTFTRDGVLYAAVADSLTNDNLVLLNPTNGTVVQTIGPIGFAPVSGLAISSSGGLYASRPIDAGHSQICRLDRSTGQSTNEVPVDRAAFDLTFSPCPAPCLDAPLNFSAANSSSSVKIADFNNDTNMDLIVAGYPRFFGGNVQVFNGDGVGNFTLLTNMALSGFSSDVTKDVAIGDFNEDGHLDWIAPNPGNCFPGPCSVVLSTNAGGAGFAVPVNLAANCSSVAAVDMDLDGHLDIVANGIVRYGDGTGRTNGFSAPSTIATGATFIAVGDVNHDGRPDLLYANSPDIGVVLSQVGGFQSPMVTTIPFNNPESFALADINGDTNLDIVMLTSENSNRRVTVLLGDGAGHFGTPTHIPIARGLGFNSALAVGDLVGDGYMDVAAVGPSGTVIVLMNDGNGNLSAPRTYPTGTSPAAVTIGDINHDGHPDIVTANNGSISILLERPSF